MNTETAVRLSIAEEFSRYPVGRMPEDAEFNGTRFRTEHLVPALNRVGPNGRLEVCFEGLEGAGSSFLEEAFGGLVRLDGFRLATLERCLVLLPEDGELGDLTRLAWMHIHNAASRM